MEGKWISNILSIFNKLIKRCVLHPEAILKWLSHSSVMPLIDGGRKGSSGGRDDGGMRWRGDKLGRAETIVCTRSPLYSSSAGSAAEVLRRSRSSLTSYRQSIWFWCHQGAMSQVETDVVASRYKQYLMTHYSFFRTFSSNWECLVPLFSGVRWFLSLALSGKSQFLFRVLWLFLRGRSGLCVFGAGTVDAGRIHSRWPDRSNMDRQEKRRETVGSLQVRSGQKTRREPFSVADWVIELEALTFFTHFSEWEMGN